MSLALFVIIIGVILLLASIGLENHKSRRMRHGLRSILLIGAIGSMIFSGVLLAASNSASAKSTSPSTAEVHVTGKVVNLEVIRKPQEVSCATQEALRDWNGNLINWQSVWLQVTMSEPQTVIAETIIVPDNPQKASQRSRVFIVGIGRSEAATLASWWNTDPTQDASSFTAWFSVRTFRTRCFADGSRAVEVMF